MHDLGYNPPILFWMVTYDDGTCLPQYDPETGRENLFADVDVKRVVKAGWYPFSPSLAEKVDIQVIVTNFPFYEVSLKGDELHIMKEQTLAYNISDTYNRRTTTYLLGWKTNEGKVIMRIKETGMVELIKEG